LAFRVFKISDEVRPTFESLSLKKDDEVKFSYYEQAIGQPVLTKIEKSSNTSPAIITGSGSYVGQADNSSIEIKLNYTNGPGPVFRVFKISDEVRPTFESLSLKTDDGIKFSYYEQAIGQPVLTKIERIPK